MRSAAVLFAGLTLPACAGWIEEDDLWLDDPSSAFSDASAYGYAAPPLPSPEDPPAIEDEPPSPSVEETLGGRRSRPYRCLWRVEVEVRPQLEATAIRRTIRRHENDIRVCYNRALRRDPTLAGRVNMMFVIRSDGTVPAAAYEHSDIADPQMLSCISKTIRRWTFPVPPDATPSLVHYPFVFSATHAR